MQIKPYNRESAVNYAHLWAYHRNPAYYDFDKIGGDCTNFISQCIFAGSNIMNTTPITGWYYKTVNNRSASWTGVEYLYNFLINNTSAGPFGINSTAIEALPGDIAQLSFDGTTFKHSLLIVESNNSSNLDNITIATHTFDADYRPISTYNFKRIRFIHIENVRI